MIYSVTLVGHRQVTETERGYGRAEDIVQGYRITFTLVGKETCDPLDQTTYFYLPTIC